VIIIFVRFGRFLVVGGKDHGFPFVLLHAGRKMKKQYFWKKEFSRGLFSSPTNH
jgi:hypothetical protein